MEDNFRVISLNVPPERFIVSRFVLHDNSFTVASVHIPNSDQERLQLEISLDLEELIDLEEDSDIFIGGDFNVCLDTDLDRKGYKHPQINNVSFRTQLHRFLEKLYLFDIWRIQNPQKRVFSWSIGPIRWPD